MLTTEETRGFRTTMPKKAKRRRRRRSPQPAQPTATVTEEASDFGGYRAVAVVFALIGAACGAIDGYDEGGLPVALILMPIAAVLVAIMGVVAVFLRSVISALFFPAMIVLIIYAVVAQN